MTDFPDMPARRAALVKAFENHIRRTTEWPAGQDFFPPDEFFVRYDDGDLLVLHNVDEGYGTYLIGTFDDWLDDSPLSCATYKGDDADDFQPIPQEDIPK